MALTQEQFSNLRSQGLSVEQIVAFDAGNTPAPAPQPQKSLLRTIVEDPVKTLVIKPAVRFGQALGSVAAGALGVSPERIQQTAAQDVSIGGINIEGQKPIGQGGGKQILGDIAKTGSYLYTGGASMGLKPLVKTSAVAGGLYSFGDSVQQAEATPASVAYNTMFGTATGAAFGLVTYGLVSGISKALELKTTLSGGGDITKINTKLNELNQEVFKPTKSQLKKAGTHDPINTYTEIFGTKLPQVDKNNRFLNESAKDFASQVDDVYRPASEAFNTILRNSPEVISLSKARQTALSNVSKASLTPNAKIAALRRVNAEFDGLISEARSKGWLRGNDNLPVEFADNFKDVFWSATRNFGSEEASISNAVNKEIGFSFKNAIEGAVKDVNVQRYNEKLGDLITLRDFLEGIGGKQAGTGGKMTRLLAGRVAGTIAGSAGGVPGAIAGNITGDILARVLIDPAMQPYRWIINKRLSQLPRAEVLKLEEEANKIIQQMFQNRIKRLALPPPTPLGTTGNPIITPAPTTFEAGVPRGSSGLADNLSGSPKQIQAPEGTPTNPRQMPGEVFPTNQRLSNQPPTTQPIINTTKNDIPTTLGQKSGGVKKSNPQAGFIQAFKNEGDLTTKILKDLEGKTTVSKQYILDATNRGELKQVERDITRQVLEDMTRGSDNPLIQEAKKYKSAEEFVKKIQGGATQYGDYFPHLRGYGMGDYKNITELGVKPDEMVTIYRGIDDTTGKIPKKINDGDFVTTDYDSAWAYAGDNKVVSMEVPAKTLYTDAIDDFKEDPFYIGSEYVYTKQKVTPMTESQLTDIWNKAQKGDTINVKEFADKVKSELLPLKAATQINPRYENISLPSEIRGNVKNYSENVYESPIKTSAGETHFPSYSNSSKRAGTDSSQNYFGHTRIEDMADNKTRRVIEVQSDLYQKGNLERELGMPKTAMYKGKEYTVGSSRNGLTWLNELGTQIKSSELNFNYDKSKLKEVAKLQQYNDPTAHFRMIREEIKKAAQDGKTKLQFPTGETAMKIEGLGQESRGWVLPDEPLQSMNRGYPQLDQTNLKVGLKVRNDYQDWIITDVLGDGKFKAVPKDAVYGEGDNFASDRILPSGERYLNSMTESFDISGKVDTNNPIYKFYEKDVQKYLQKFGGKKVVDDKGVSWIEIPITKEQGKAPVDAFGKIKGSPLIVGAGVLGATAIGTSFLSDKKKKK